MTAFYDAKRKNAYDALKKRGTRIILKDPAEGELNKITGAYTEGTVTEYITYGGILEKKVADGGMGRRETTTLMVANYNPSTGGELGLTIKTSTLLNYNGSDYVIVSNDPFQFGGIVVYWKLTVAGK